VPYRSVFATTNSNLDSGGGKVSFHEKRALASVTRLDIILTEKDIESMLLRVNDDAAQAFLWDYFAACELKHYKADVAFFNGSPFGICTQILKPAKIIVDLPTPNLELSVSEYERLTSKGFPFTKLTDPIKWNIYSFHIRNADVVLCPSKFSASYIKKKIALTNRVVVIPHGCYLPNKDSLLEPSSFSVAHIGINGADKGQTYLVQAWQKLKQNADFAGNITIVGLGTNFWAQFGVFSFEHISNNKIGKVYCDCSVYVQPSVTEGFGIPVLEAMAYERPVIVTEGAGACELVEDGKEGFIIPIRDPDAIKDKIEYFHDNPDEVKRMGKNARKKAEKYTWDIIEEKYQKLIMEVLNE